MIVLYFAFNARYFKNQEINLLLLGLVRLEWKISEGYGRRYE